MGVLAWWSSRVPFRLDGIPDCPDAAPSSMLGEARSRVETGFFLRY